MRKLLYCIVLMMGALVVGVPANAKTQEEEALVNELKGGLPVYVGNNISWTDFDILDNGSYMVAYTSTALPAAKDITEEVRSKFREILTHPMGANKGLINFTNKMKKSLVIRLYNGSKELCIEEIITPK